MFPRMTKRRKKMDQGSASFCYFVCIPCYCFPAVYVLSVISPKSAHIIPAMYQPWKIKNPTYVSISRIL